MSGEVARYVIAVAASENHLLTSLLAIPLVLGGAGVFLGRTVSPLLPNDGKITCGTEGLAAVVVGV